MRDTGGILGNRVQADSQISPLPQCRAFELEVKAHHIIPYTGQYRHLNPIEEAIKARGDIYSAIALEGESYVQLKYEDPCRVRYRHTGDVEWWLSLFYHGAPVEPITLTFGKDGLVSLKGGL